MTGPQSYLCNAAVLSRVEGVEGVEVEWVRQWRGLKDGLWP